MQTIDVPAHAVVIAIGGRKAPLAELLDLVPATAAPWNVDKPEKSTDGLRDALKADGRARVAMARAHPKAVREAAAIARKHGAETILLRLPGSPDVADALDKMSATHDLADAGGVSFRVVPMAVDLSHVEGPFDIIGDIHGAADELEELLTRLGHMVDGQVVRHPDGRTPVFVGDYTARGPRNKDALEIVRTATGTGGLAILGNHDEKLRKWLEGRNVRVAAGLAMTIEELERETPEWRASMADWLGSLQTHLVLDRGRLVVAHAGLSEDLHGRMTSGATSMALYGRPLDGGNALDADGFPAAEDWGLAHEGSSTIVHGHVVHPEPRILENAAGGMVVGIDQGAVFGGSLTAYRWPEREFEQVKAHRPWFEPRGRQITS